MEPAGSSPAASLVQQALREVLWGDLVATELPEHLRKDVEAERGLEGNFLVDGVKVEMKKTDGGEVSVEEWSKGYEVFERSLHNPKMGMLVKMVRRKYIERWEMRCVASDILFMSWKLGRNMMGRFLAEAWVEQGGLVASIGKTMKMEVRGDGVDGIAGTIVTSGSGNVLRDMQLTVNYTMKRV